MLTPRSGSTPTPCARRCRARVRSLARSQVGDEFLGFAQDSRRVRSGHAAVGCDDQDGDTLGGVLAFFRKRMVQVRVDRDRRYRLGRAFS